MPMTPHEYHDRCKRHDWQHDNSDDHSVWTRGQRERRILREAAEASPELFAIWRAWNAHAYHGGAIPPRPDVAAVATFPGAVPALIPGQLSLDAETAGSSRKCHCTTLGGHAHAA
jgi:hypothetical protein